jgi:hypothetical protein
MRTLWSALIDDRRLLQTAYSVDGVAEELLYVAGPLIAGLIAVVAAPAAGLGVTAGLVVTGTGLFVRSPALLRWPAPAARAAAGDCPAASRPAPGGQVILTLALVTGAIGLCLGGLGLVAVAFSRARHDPAAVAWIEAALSAGAALSGQLIGQIPLGACLPVLAAPALLAVLPLLRARFAPPPEQLVRHNQSPRTAG